MNKLLIYKYPVTKTNVQEIAYLKYFKIDLFSYSFDIKE